MGGSLTDSIQIMQRVIAHYRNNPKWDNAPLGPVKSLSNSHVGQVGQDFVRDLCAELGIQWARCCSAEPMGRQDCGRHL